MNSWQMFNDPRCLLEKYEQRVKQEKMGATCEELADLCDLLRRVLDEYRELDIAEKRLSVKKKELEHRIAAAVEIMTGKNDPTNRDGDK
jgi:predicted transcriptional regulator